MLVEVDEARGHDEASYVDRTACAQWSGGDAGDFSIADADVADCVERGFGVDDAAALKHDIVLLGVEGRARNRNRTQVSLRMVAPKQGMIAGLGEGACGSRAEDSLWRPWQG